MSEPERFEELRNRLAAEAAVGNAYLDAFTSLLHKADPYAAPRLTLQEIILRIPEDVRPEARQLLIAVERLEKEVRRANG